MKRYNSPLYRKNREILKRRYMMGNLPCYYCGLPIDFDAPADSPLSFTADHVIPYDAGGSDSMSNLVGAHRACNRAKSDSLSSPMARSDRVKPTRRWW